MTQPERVKSIKNQMTQARALLRGDLSKNEAGRQQRELAMEEVIEFVAGDMSAATIYTAKRMAREILR